MKNNRKNLATAGILLTAFLLWTIAIQRIDVQPIGPLNSAVGFATLNRLVHNLTGVHIWLYTLTDGLSFIPLLLVAGFAFLGLTQWFKRRHIFKVDHSILVLGVFYGLVFAAFIFFEIFVVNYRPILIEGVLEASYPSSTTMLVMCVIPTAVMQLKDRMRNSSVKRSILFVLTVFGLFMVIGRLISGVHWFTDIIGGALLSGSFIMLYKSFT